MKTLDDLLDSIEWSPPLKANTRYGPRRIKKAPITKQFWAVWETDRERFKALLKRSNVSIARFRDMWELTWWSREDLSFAPLATEHSAFAKPAPEPEPEIILPELSVPDTLFPFQQVSVQMGLVSMAKYNRVLLGHSTGVGKTFCALGIARELKKRVAVVCPKAITTDWYRAAKLMGVDVLEVVGWEWCKTNKSQLGQWKDAEKKAFTWTIPDDCILVFDECHRARSFGSQNSFLVRDAVHQNIQSIALSATIADDPTRLSALGEFLGLHKGGRDYYRFLSEHGCTRTKFGMNFKGGQAILKRIHKKIYPERGNRLRHSDLGDAFPETLIKPRAFDMDSAREIASEYDDLQIRVEELRQGEHAAANILAEQTKARMRVELLKAPAVASLVRDLLDDGNSVFVSVNFTETREFLEEELKTKCSIYGGQSDMDRRGAIDSFQNDKSRVIIGMIQACREGLNLHDTKGTFPRVALHMPTYSSFDLKQVLGRVHRAGGKTRSTQYIVYAAGVMLEEDICTKLDAKLKNMDILADGKADDSINLDPTKQIVGEQKSLDIPTE
jgi:superfamily II DNA or RNA helicase